jgi:hypothetical protein
MDHLKYNWLILFINNRSFRCPYRKQNYDYAQYLLTALYFESWVNICLDSIYYQILFVLVLEN